MKSRVKNLSTEFIRIIFTGVAYAMLYLPYINSMNNQQKNTDGAFLVLIMLYLFSIFLTSIENFLQTRVRADFILQLFCVITGIALISTSIISLAFLECNIIGKVNDGLKLAMILLASVFIIPAYKDLGLELIKKWNTMKSA